MEFYWPGIPWIPMENDIESMGSSFHGISPIKFNGILCYTMENGLMKTPMEYLEGDRCHHESPGTTWVPYLMVSHGIQIIAHFRPQ
jgi:hypothetical protein